MTGLCAIPLLCPLVRCRGAAWAPAASRQAGGSLSRLVCRCGLVGHLGASSKLGHWGYWYDGLEPAMVVTSGAELTVDMPTFIAGPAWAEMGAGDPAMEDLYTWDEHGPRVAYKGPYGTSGAPRQAQHSDNRSGQVLRARGPTAPRARSGSHSTVLPAEGLLMQR